MVSAHPGEDSSPVELVHAGYTHREVRPGIALCLSGGGYRAMLFHVGALWRLHETDVLAETARISSVPGASIAATILDRLLHHSRAPNIKGCSYRLRDLNQVRRLRKRQLIDAYITEDRQGAYRGIRTDIIDYGFTDPLNCPYESTVPLAEIPTRLKRFHARHQERLINLGYSACDAATIVAAARGRYLSEDCTIVIYTNDHAYAANSVVFPIDERQ